MRHAKTALKLILDPVNWFIVLCIVLMLAGATRDVKAIITDSNNIQTVGGIGND
jgi:hypothetical protein